MEILFKTKRLQRLCVDHRERGKKLGQKRSKILQRRLDDLRAAEDLATMRTLPGRCHELRENLAGMLSIDLDGPYRLIFEPATEPIPRRGDGGLDWKRVRAVRICGVEDTHV